MSFYHCNRAPAARGILFAVALCALVCSCSRQESANKTAAMNVQRSAGNVAAMAMDRSEAAAESAGVQTDATRKLVKNGSLSFEVENLAESEQAITGWATGFGGYVASSWADRTSLSLTVKIPADAFDRAMGSAGSFGRLLSRSVSLEDVSEQFYDLQARLETRRILEEKLRGYLKNASATADLLEIESQLNKVQTEIESMEGRFRRLSNRIEYATITVNGQLPENTTDDGPERPAFFRSLSKLGSNILYFLSGFIIVLLYIVIFGIPVVLAVACLYWLCFGKIGLVRKLFVSLSRGKKE